MKEMSTNGGQNNLRDGSKDQRAHDTDNFNIGDKSHSGGVVLFSPGLDLAGNVGNLSSGRIGGASGGRREDGGEDVGPCVIERVEEGKDRVGNQRG